MRHRLTFATGFLLLAFVVPARLDAADWPAWRFDANRSAASPASLPARLQLQWTRDFPRLTPAWLDQPKMRFDAAYEPVVMGKRLFVGSPREDTVAAFDTETGHELWKVFADGPVRFAPLAWENRVYFVSDDGFLHCVSAETGSLLWKFRGGPSDRRVLGNERLISTWPARGAPVIADGTVYFAAGIWPFMGIFLHALDARTGEVVWTNDGDGSTYMKQPHNADAFAGVAPQGPLVVLGDKLLIPGGRSVPAGYDRTTGKLIHYQLAENAKRGGGFEVAAMGNLFFNGGAAFDLTNGNSLGAFTDFTVLTGQTIYGTSGGKCRAYDPRTSQVNLVETVDRKGEKVKVPKWTITETAAVELLKPTALIKAGSRLYAGSLGSVQAIDLPLLPGAKVAPSWQAAVSGTPASLVAADDKLFVVTQEGRLYCFGGSAPQKAALAQKPDFSEKPGFSNAADNWTVTAKSILETTGVRDGYCVAWGVGTGRLITELARQSNLRIIAVDPDATRVHVVREKLIAAGLYGARVAVLAGDPQTFAFPPYLAALIVAEDPQSAGIEVSRSFCERIYPVLRPYGGVACLPWTAQAQKPGLERSLISPSRANSTKKLDSESQATLSEKPGFLSTLVNSKLTQTGDWLLLAREGALPDTANWTHEHADAANTRVSRDKLVKAPLGVLWFGGSSNEAILPRHGHGPQPQVIDGRLIIEGTDLLRAMDIYTGRVLWEAKLPGVGKFYDNTAHQPGANASGANFISTSDGIYVVHGKSCVRLDPATGRKIAEFQLPTPPEAKQPPVWGYLSVSGDYLVGGAEPLVGEKPDPLALVTPIVRGNDDTNSSSRQLVVMDRHDGKVFWTVAAQNGFRHNAICAGGGRLYCIDRLSGPQIARLKRRGETPGIKPRLLTLDLQTGKEIWSSEDDIFGTWLSYSEQHDVLVEAGRTAGDTLSDEPRGMRAWRADRGTALWRNGNAGPAMLRHDEILMAGKACHLLTGAPRMRDDPLTGLPVEWTWSRTYGCNTPSASEHLLTFRSGAAGYFDLCRDGGTGNFGGFRSSCSNNLIVAGGVLTAPDYTRTCVCSYQNQTSLALVHMPEAEAWTFFGMQEVTGPVKRLGINFAAPGDRKADDGTLWLEYPSVGGQSPVVPVTVSGAPIEWFRRHASQVAGDLNWVAASGGKGIRSVTLGVAKASLEPGRVGPEERRYKIRLHFMEPDTLEPGERIFDVALQGVTKLAGFDIVKEAGGRNRALVKEFSGIGVTHDLVVTLSPVSSAKNAAPLLCGIEVIAE